MRHVWMGLCFLAACTSPGSVVPVIGDAASLAGKWEGTFSSDETGRTGSILFTLKAGTDSAYGDVVMVPVAADEAAPPGRIPIEGAHYHRLPRVITISFVRCEDAEVTGRLNVYPDPDTNESVYTTFTGQLKGNTLKGAFVSLFEASGHRAAGKWEVTRKAAP